MTGGLIGLFAVLLVEWGNPGNMGFCIACFERDIAGALGLHQAKVVQYLRPEIMGLVLGAFIAALFFKNFHSEGGSSPLIRFVLGILVMIGVLVFLGCPTRMILRVAGGDINALIGLAGFCCGILLGAYFIRSGSDFGNTQMQPVTNGWIMPIIMLALLALLFGTKYISGGENWPVNFSESGPGALKAPIIIALIAGLVCGFAMQRTRLCFVSGLLNIFRGKDLHMSMGIAAIFLITFIGNLITGSFKLSVAKQPVAHTDYFWNFLPMVLVGLGSCLLRGCPMRQLILTGQGNTDSAISVLGMIVGAAFAHNFLLAASPAGVPYPAKIAVVTGLVICCLIAVFNRKK
ncbi:MAG: YedE-related selenium metabolism membrane protein [Planctomycetes bacterium]|nr:YedE-related selenium metabolism membrane protein [Planctomycetota bacterium]